MFLKKEGFKVEENVSGFQTVFIANYGEGKPVISGVYYDYQTAFSLFQSRKVPGKIVVRHE